jgi:four helix bundle protein
MKYNRFEELPVWQDAIELAVLIFDLTSRPPFRQYYGLKDQLERAGVSVSNNIAEGFERGTTQETLTFIYISRGSAGEVRSLSYLLEQLAAFREMLSEILDMRSRALSISRQLHGWASSLQNTDMRGQRYVTEKAKRAAIAKREREEFLRELAEIRNRGRKS